MTPGLGFLPQNLRRNPFGELEPAEQTALAVVELEHGRVEDWALWLEGGRRALQLVGPAGRGKTTHLLALAARLPGWTWRRPTPEGECAPAPSGGGLLLDDGQRLGSRALRALCGPARGLALTSQRDHGRALRGVGFEVRAVEVRELTPSRLEELVRRRVEAVRRGPGPVPFLPAGAAATLLRDARGDVRAVLARLYERVQEATVAGPLA